MLRSVLGQVLLDSVKKNVGIDTSSLSPLHQETLAYDHHPISASLVVYLRDPWNHINQHGLIGSAKY